MPTTLFNAVATHVVFPGETTPVSPAYERMLLDAVQRYTEGTATLEDLLMLHSNDYLDYMYSSDKSAYVECLRVPQVTHKPLCCICNGNIVYRTVYGTAFVCSLCSPPGLLTGRTLQASTSRTIRGVVHGVSISLRKNLTTKQFARYTRDKGPRYGIPCILAKHTV